MKFLACFPGVQSVREAGFGLRERCSGYSPPEHERAIRIRTYGDFPMCGVVGWLRTSETGTADSDAFVRIRDSMIHRGPDGAGIWVCPTRRTGLGFRRLAIVDLSPVANQPMANEDGSVQVVFNGEIYNHRLLRREPESKGAKSPPPPTFSAMRTRRPLLDRRKKTTSAGPGSKGSPATRHQKKSLSHTPGRFWREALIIAALLLLGIAVYGQLLGHEFINFDDDVYVYQNREVKHGLSMQGIAWAFTSLHASNWHPLTWLSHMLDCQTYGLKPGLHHLTSLVFHLANTLLLFLVLRRMTSGLWQSAFVAALFAIHPLHVESVAWIAERKDVLSAFFLMLMIWAYVRWVEAPSSGRYLLVVAMLAAGLMAKPMLVTAPFLLLLLDCWPLGRLQPSPGISLSGLRTGLWPLVREKLPLLALATISSAVTYFAQLKGGALQSFERLPLWPRIINGLTSFVSYIRLMIWPDHLAVMYPHPAAGTDEWKAILAFLLIAGTTALVVWKAPTRGFLATGWFWYLGMLIPVSGLVQVGGQAMADRYTYLPLIGLFLIIAWELGLAVNRWPSQRITIVTLSVAALLILTVRAHIQSAYWQNNVTLYERTLVVAPDNPNIMLNLGAELVGQRKFDDAISWYEQALRLEPNSGRAHAALGTALAQVGEHERAMRHLKQALEIDPSSSYANNSMGVLLMSRKRHNEAIPFLRDAARLDINNAEAHNNLGAALLFEGKPQEAIAEFKAALTAKPEYAEAADNLKTAGSAILK